MTDISNDGVSHINVYSRGQTWLGRQLSNFAHTPFHLPVLTQTMVDNQHAASVEGVWYWIGSGCQYPHLLQLSGYAAKKAGREYPRVSNERFPDMIRTAILHKLHDHPEITHALAMSKLPLYHYYVTRARACVTPPRANDWVIDWLRHIRELLWMEPTDSQEVITALIGTTAVYPRLPPGTLLSETTD